jgi:hypothetical protein
MPGQCQATVIVDYASVDTGDEHHATVRIPVDQSGTYADIIESATAAIQDIIAGGASPTLGGAGEIVILQFHVQDLVCI